MDEQDIVLDPFLGSGTTCIAANEKNISSVGIEKSEKYFQLCKTLMDGIQLRVGAIWTNKRDWLEANPFY